MDIKDRYAGVIGNRFWTMDSNRLTQLERCRTCAALTLPYILPPEGHDEDDDLPTPYNGLGAEGVNNIANKLMITLLPPNEAFFSIRLSEEDRQMLKMAGNKDADIAKSLQDLEAIIVEMVNDKRLRKIELFKNLVVTGNALLYLPREGYAKVFKLDKYVVKRDHEGNPLEIIVREVTSPAAIPDVEVRAKVIEKGMDEHSTISFYTQAKLEDGEWVVRQEVCGEEYDTPKTYPKNLCPYKPLRYEAIDGENYGRGLVEQYLGDISSLDGFTQMLFEGAAAASKVLILVKDGLSQIQDMNDAPNGSFVPGDPAGVGALELGKGMDFQVAQSQSDRLSARLSRAFLLNSSVQRDAERVTAEEIRYLAQELEDALGGVYSTLAFELQAPVVEQLMYYKKKRMPNGLKPVISSGLNALGRNREVIKIQTFLSLLNSTIPEGKAYIDAEQIVLQLANATGISGKDVVKSKEQVMQEQAQAAMQQAAIQSAPKIADNMSKPTGGERNG
jgi:hypothetical protein